MPASVLSYNSVVSVCAKVGATTKAEGWLGDMTKRGVAPDMISCSTVINASLQRQLKDRAAHWLAEMKACGQTPSNFNYPP